MLWDEIGYLYVAYRTNRPLVVYLQEKKEYSVMCLHWSQISMMVSHRDLLQDMTSCKVFRIKSIWICGDISLVSSGGGFTYFISFLILLITPKWHGFTCACKHEVFTLLTLWKEKVERWKNCVGCDNERRKIHQVVRMRESSNIFQWRRPHSIRQRKDEE